MPRSESGPGACFYILYDGLLQKLGFAIVYKYLVRILVFEYLLIIVHKTRLFNTRNVVFTGFLNASFTHSNSKCYSAAFECAFYEMDSTAYDVYINRKAG